MYIVLYDSCDPYVCPMGAAVFKNKKALKEFYSDVGFDKNQRVFKVKKEVSKNEIIFHSDIFS